MKRPYYTLNVDVFGCDWEILVNGVPLLRDRLGRPVVVEVPINQWIWNGKNELSVRFRALPGEEVFGDRAACRVAVFVREVDAPKDSRIEVVAYEWHVPEASAAVQSEEFWRGEPGVDKHVHRTGIFESELPFRLWRWSTSRPIDPGTEGSLILVVEDIHRRLAEKDVDGLLSLTRVKNEELAVAHYFPATERIADNSSTLWGLVNSDDLTLCEWPADRLRVGVYGHNRLARVEATAGKSPLCFASADRSRLVFLPLFFCREGESGWLAVR